MAGGRGGCPPLPFSHLWAPARVASSGVGPQAEQRASKSITEGLGAAPPGKPSLLCSPWLGTGCLQRAWWEGSSLFPVLALITTTPGLVSPHTAGCGPLCCSRRRACLSASLLFLLATLAALIALVTILGLPSRTPGQGSQERVGQTRWEGHGGAQRDEGALTCLASLPDDFGQIP